MTAFTTGFAQKTLVLYYSETGTTKTVAQEIQKQLNADMESIEAVKPYSGNFQETMQRGQREMQSGETPALKPLKSKIADYDVIFLGYPIWWYHLPMIARTFFEKYDFSGKTIIPYVTHGGSRDGGTFNEIKELEPNATVLDGLAVSGQRAGNSESDVNKWLAGLGY